MNYALAIFNSPTGSAGQQSGYRFACAALAAGHRISRIFFYGDGVANGSALLQPPQGEVDVAERWRALAQAHGIELVVCIAAALKRGLLDAREAQRYGKGQHNLASGFELSGLGQLVEAAASCDRLITFG